MTRTNRLSTLLIVVGLTAWMTLCDRYFHLSTDTVRHFWGPFMGDGQTVWVLACFGLGSLGILATAPKFAADHPSAARFGVEVLVMTTVYASSGFFGADHPALVTLAFSALLLIRLAFSSHRGQILTAGLVLGVTGPLFESLQWHLGMFEYTRPDVIGVPWWLFPFYANGAWAMRELGGLLTRTDRPVPEAQPAAVS